MASPTIAVLVSFRSELDHDEVVRAMSERAPGFRALEGLEQKYYLKGEGAGEYGGLYLWRSQDDLVDYRMSDLAATISSAYRIAGAPEVQVFEILMPVRD